MEALYKNVSMGLLTDLYQITMGQGYWKLGKHEQPSVFQLYFRKLPFKGGYVVNAGLDTALEYLEQWRFSESDCEYLKGLRDGGEPLFDPEYIDFLGALKVNVKVYAVAEGDMVFPNEPLVRLEGPLLQCQLLETPLLTIIGFQSLVATKASRLASAATSGNVLDFGLRRAQGPDGGVSVSRAAFIGGCTATSNCLAGKLFKIPVKGTHSHSWVMSFKEEMDAFQAYADVFPHSTVLLVDTYDTDDGIMKAVEVGKRLAAKGHKLDGIRLDSGDLAAHSIKARQAFDSEGLDYVKIVASDDLDESRITDFISRGARIDVWGVGTRLATCYDQPALGCVYKLAAVDEGDGWRYVMKAAVACPSKASIPGALKVMRYKDKNGVCVKDVIYDNPEGLPEPPEGGSRSDVLSLRWSGNSRTQPALTVQDIQRNTLKNLAAMPKEVTKVFDAERYPVEIEAGLVHRRDDLLKTLTHART
eukprot:TRINITY_DN24775_c0_g1_i1.p1 TRINITY_DN24775_c0_g1~~TRINITY_DN24775_c0_g1_i1.p1  ORF type:complete len:474 (+),score=137.10 TRINITY_DN24775_c0_g1_i1:52-1473(+)